MHTQYEDELELEEELEGEYESEWELEDEGEWEAEYEDEGEEFLRPLTRGLSRSLRQCLPAVRRLAGPAAGLVASAVQGTAGGALGGAPLAGTGADLELEAEELVEAAVADLGDRLGEFEDPEFEEEYETEWEFEDEATAPLPPAQATAELMAAVAATTGSESEAEAMVAGAAALTLSRSQRAAVRRLIPQLVRGAILLSRILRQRPGARNGLRILPTVMRQTAVALDRRAATGRPLTRRTAAGVMAGQTRRVLGDPRTSARALQRNLQATRAARGVPPVSPGVRRPRQLA